jgi:hypothetical protein
LFDVFVVANVLVAELVELLFEGAFFVFVFVVGDIVEPGCGHGVEYEVLVLAAVLEVLVDQVYGCFCDCFHVCVSV